jgi:hypothetical protein
VRHVIDLTTVDMSLRYLLLPKLVATAAADPPADVRAGLGVAQDDIVVGAVA